MELYLTQKELREIFSVSKQTIWRWTNKHGLPHIKINNTIRYNKQDAIDWFEQHQINGDRRTKGVGNV